MTELRIKIKEIVEERRNITFEEECILLVASWSKSNIGDNAKKYLIDIGFVDHSRCGPIATFRKETIRDATLEEEDAWWYLFKAKGCQKRLNARNAGDCDCIISGECITTLHRREKAETILKGKEVILELVE